MTLFAGEALCLHLNEPYDMKAIRLFVAFLNSNPACAGGSRAVLAEPVTAGRWPFGAGTTQALLRQRIDKRSAVEVETFLSELGFSGREDLRKLGLTARMQLGLKLAEGEGEIVVFSSAGLDPLGVQTVFSTIEGWQAQGGAAIHLCYPSMHGRECLKPGGKCFEIEPSL